MQQQLVHAHNINQIYPCESGVSERERERERVGVFALKFGRLDIVLLGKNYAQISKKII